MRDANDMSVMTKRKQETVLKLLTLVGKYCKWIDQDTYKIFFKFNITKQGILITYQRIRHYYFPDKEKFVWEYNCKSLLWDTKQNLYIHGKTCHSSAEENWTSCKYFRDWKFIAIFYSYTCWLDKYFLNADYVPGTRHRTMNKTAEIPASWSLRSSGRDKK